MNGSAYYNATALVQQQQQMQQSFYSNASTSGGNLTGRGSNLRVRFNTQTQTHPASSANMHNLSRNLLNRQAGTTASLSGGGYQLKVGGVVVGSWAGAPSRGTIGNSIQMRTNRNAAAANQYYPRYQIANARGRNSVNTRLQRNAAQQQQRGMARNAFGVKVQRNRRPRKFTRGNKSSDDAKKENESDNEAGAEERTDAETTNQNG